MKNPNSYQDHFNTTTMAKSALVGSGGNGNHADRVSQPKSADVLPIAMENFVQSLGFIGDI